MMQAQVIPWRRQGLTRIIIKPIYTVREFIAE
jgi:hypothetical protein